MTFNAGAPADGGYRRSVLIFYLCFFLLSSSGHLGSADAGAQLQASMLLVTTGRLVAPAPPSTLASGWVRTQGGAYAEPHDIGNALLMLPAAWLGRLVSDQPAQSLFDQPPAVSRLAVSLTYGVASAVACVLVFQLFALACPRRQAFLLSLALPVSTMFWVYAKTTWDVMGACCAVCAVLYYGASIARGREGPRELAGLGCAVAIAGSFRYSLLPFLILGAVGLLFSVRRHLASRAVAAGVFAMTIGLLPTLGYNYVRTGSPFWPATASAEYLQANNALTGDIGHGFWSLFFSPNRGLFVFSPICLLLLTLPFVWRRISEADRRTLAAIGAGALMYVLFIAKLKNWGGSFGWGPRFLVPVLPVAFYGAMLAFMTLWNTWRTALATLVVVSALLSAAPVLVNWSVAIVAYPAALEQDARRPYQHEAVWRQLALGLARKPPVMPAVIANDPERSPVARFPDFWTVRLLERSQPERVAGVTISLLLLIVAGRAAYVLIADRQSPRARAV